jgi:hypothetical protein
MRAAYGGDWSSSVTWQGNKATIGFTEPLADTKAAKGERPFSVITGPYISWLTEDSARISWEVIAEKSILDKSPYFVSEKPAYPFETNLAIRSAELPGLKPDSEYQYCLASSGQGWSYTGATHTFRTFPPPGSKKLRFAIIGDTQRGWHNPHWADRGGTIAETVKLGKFIKEWNPPLVLHMGDLTLQGSFDTWEAKCNYIGVINNLSFMSSSFMAACVGNHDGMKFHNAYFPYITKEAAPGAASRSGFFSFDAANVHFACVSAIPSRTALAKWLDQDLRNTKQQWVMAFSHQPYHSLGFFNTKPTELGPCGLLNTYKVPLYFCGHDHSYQRTARISNDDLRTMSDSGTVHVVSGGAGSQSPQYTLPTPAWNLAYVTKYHYVQAEVDDAVVSFRAIDTEGVVFDRWKMPLRGQPETVFEGTPFVMADDRDAELKYNNPWKCDDPVSAVWSNPTWKQRRLNHDCWRNHASYSKTAGDHVAFTFSGTSIAWIGAKSKAHGMADVFIDGARDRVDVDAYAPKTMYQQVLYEKGGLPPGTHEIKIVVTGRKNAAATDNLVEIDAFRFTPSPAAGANKGEPRE